MRKLILMVFLGFIGAFVGVLMWMSKHEPAATPSTSTLIVLPQQRVITGFDLIDDRGQKFTINDLRGHWSMIFFGFSHCPDICPGTLNDMKAIKEAFDWEHPDAAPLLQVVFISVDPERDTPTELKQYVDYFHPGFKGVTGTEEDLARLAEQMGITYSVEKHEPGDMRYDIEHTASVLLTNPQGRLYGIFPAPHNPGKMITDLVKAIK